MSTIRRVPVTLTPEESSIACDLLRALESQDWDHSRRTKSAAIRQFSIDRATKARDLEAAIVRRMYEQTETVHTATAPDGRPAR